MRRLLTTQFLAPSLLVLLAAAASVACGGDGASGPDGADSAAGAAAVGGNGAGGERTGNAAGGGSDSDAAAGQGAGPGDPRLNEGEYNVDAFGYQDTQPQGFNPLGRDRFHLLRLEETAFVLNGGDGGFYLDDAQHGLTRSPLGSALAPANAQPVWTGSGNLDDDGNAELVLLSHGATAIAVTIGDNDGSKPLAKNRSFSVPHGGATAGAIKAALGDFDGDGRQEIALAATAGQAGWVRIYDDASANFALVKEIMTSANGQGDLDLAAGNFDADANSELAVLRVGSSTDDASVFIFDDASQDFGLRDTIPAQALLPGAGAGNDYSRWLSGGIVRTGNVDHDAQDELYVLLSHQDVDSNGTGNVNVEGRVFDQLTTAPTLLASPGVPNGENYPQKSLERPYDAAFADMDGDGVDELYTVHIGSDAPTYAWYLSQWLPNENPSSWNQPVSYRKLDTGYNPIAFGRLAVISGDELAGETLIVALKNTGSEHPLRTLRILGEASVQADDEHQSFALDIPAAEPTAVSYPSSAVPLVAGGDFDNDNLQVRYTGNKWQSLASPRPIAVLAAPPLNAGIEQGEDASGTAFGKEALRGSASTDELGASYGTTMSFDSSALTDLLGGPLGGLASASISKSVERAFAYSETTSVIESYSTSYASAYPDDCIVFQGVLHTSYEYEVMTSSEPAAVGRKLTIDVPVAVKTYKWTLGFYNEKLGQDGVQIGAETLGHAVGDPASYPSARDRDQLLGKYSGWRSEQVSVGQGNGENSVSISLSNETTTASTNTITNDDSWGVAVAGLAYSESRAVTGTTVYEVTVGSATNYEGIVGDILEGDDYLNYSYDFGLFVYQYQHPKGPRFQVVNYWTSNLGPGFP
jgi:hypothetical protein